MRYSSENPLQEWIFFDQPEVRQMLPFASRRKFVMRLFEGLEDALKDVPEGGRVKLGDRFFSLPGLVLDLSKSEMERFAAASRKIMTLRGPGTQRAEEGLLRLLGGTGASRLVPFWIELLGYVRARDQFSKRRSTLALAALAYAAVRSEGPLSEALTALVGSLQHKDPTVRAEAAYCLGEVFPARGEEAPAEIVEALERCAHKGRALRSRYMARQALARLGAPLPVAPEGGAYAFKVWHLEDPAVYRVLEIGSGQNLHALHHAVQEAFGWDADHLYIFWIGDAAGDPRFGFAHDAVEDAAVHAWNVPVGAVGIVPRNRLLYLFDFGDHHRFALECVGVRERADEGSLPRVIEAVGKPMDQYPRW